MAEAWIASGGGVGHHHTTFQPSTFSSSSPSSSSSSSSLPSATIATYYDDITWIRHPQSIWGVVTQEDYYQGDVTTAAATTKKYNHPLQESVRLIFGEVPGVLDMMNAVIASTLFM